MADVCADGHECTHAHSQTQVYGCTHTNKLGFV